MDLLQIATGITKCDDYYKLRQYTPEIRGRRRGRAGRAMVLAKSNRMQISLLRVDFSGKSFGSTSLLRSF